jgi:hypothetical protein
MDKVDPGLRNMLKYLTDMEDSAEPRYKEYYTTTRAALERMTKRHDFG